MRQWQWTCARSRGALSQIEPVIRPTEFNYAVDICGKWRGTRYRFIQRYRSGFPENLGEEFDALFTLWTGSAPGASTFSGIGMPANSSAYIAACR
jgi:hypothetical protein